MDNSIAQIYIHRNKIEALFGDDPTFTIYDVDEPLPDGTIDIREDGHTLNIVGTDITKLAILQDKLGNSYDKAGKVYIDYYFSREGIQFTNIKDRPNLMNNSMLLDTQLDIKMLFEGNPHFSRFWAGIGPQGGVWCIVFKPELIQYLTGDGTAIHGKRSCAMEDIARDVLTCLKGYRFYFSTEDIEGKNYSNRFKTVTIEDCTSF